MPSIREAIFRSRSERRALTPLQMWGSDYWPDDNPSGERVTQGNATALATVYACQTLIADTVASLPVDVFREVNELPVRVEPEPEWLETPIPNDPSVTRAAHFSQVAMSLLADGNAFVHVSPHVMAPRVLTVLDPRTVRIDRDGGLRPVYRVSGRPDGLTEFSAANMLHIPRTIRPGETRGLSPIDEASITLGTFLAATKHAGRFYRNGALLATVLEVPGEMSAPDAKALREAFDEAHTGENVFRTGVLTGGAKATTLGVTPEQAQFLDTLRHGTVEVCRIYRVPPMLVGVNEPGAVSYASAVEAVKAFARNTLAPFLRPIELAYGRLLGDETYLRFDLNGLMRADPEARYAAYAIGLEKGFLSRNEVRAWEEMPAIPGDGGDLYTVQSQMTDLEKVANPPEPPEAPPAPPAGGPSAGPDDAEDERHLAGQHDQKSHGAGKGYGPMAEKARAGGFSTSLHGAVPKDGFMVSPYKGAERRYSASSFSRDDVVGYRNEHADLLRRPNHYLGGWRDGEDIYLDVSVRTPDLGSAVRLARENGQLAVYDVAGGTSIYTKEAA